MDPTSSSTLPVDVTPRRCPNTRFEAIKCSVNRLSTNVLKTTTKTAMSNWCRCADKELYKLKIFRVIRLPALDSPRSQLLSGRDWWCSTPLVMAKTFQNPLQAAWCLRGRMLTASKTSCAHYDETRLQTCNVACRSLSVLVQASSHSLPIQYLRYQQLRWEGNQSQLKYQRWTCFTISWTCICKIPAAWIQRLL